MTAKPQFLILNYGYFSSDITPNIGEILFMAHSQQLTYFASLYG